MCRNCSSWGRVTCAECGQRGHPASHCPDVWRRYHNTVRLTLSILLWAFQQNSPIPKTPNSVFDATFSMSSLRLHDTPLFFTYASLSQQIDASLPLVENRQIKKNHQLYCSGCTRRGHLVHTCRLALPFSGLPINSPYVALYRPVYKHDEPKHKGTPDTTTTPPPVPRNKRQSKSPTVHETHVNKKRNMTVTDIVETTEKQPERPRKNSQSKTQTDDKATEPKTTEPPKVPTVEPAPDFIPISSTNHDERGQMIQDNEVSDTSDVVTSARIYITNDMIDRLKTPDGETWLKENLQKWNITMPNADITSFLNIKGKVADQEAFQAELREWSKHGSNKENVKSDNEANVTQDSENDQSFFNNNIPKNRNNLLRKLTKALESLKDDLGDPKAIWNELNYLQNRHQQLLKQKVISPKQLNNNRTHINDMLKKLNMVLLGQAGLADGSKHLSELHSLHEKLTNFRQKTISLDLRKEIGEHYHTIFTAIPRNDYAELLKMYYVTKKQIKIKNNNMQKPQVGGKKRKKQKKKAPAQSGPTSGNTANETGKYVRKEQNVHSRESPGFMAELAACHRKMMQSRPADGLLKKTRVELCRKLHGYIVSLFRKEQIPSKTMKKMRKVHEQARNFLSNV